jgi:hypothetical protein
MNKQTKIGIGIAIILLLGYCYWKPKTNENTTAPTPSPIPTPEGAEPIVETTPEIPKGAEPIAEPIVIPKGAEPIVLGEVPIVSDKPIVSTDNFVPIVSVSDIVPDLGDINKELQIPIIVETKNCVVTSFDCTSSTNKTIQIPMDADCNTYQPAKPNCMKSPDLVFPDFLPKPTPKPTTKDCVLEYYNCTNYSYETIQIDMNADCNSYQPAKPNCMKPSNDLVFPDFLPPTDVLGSSNMGRYLQDNPVLPIDIQFDDYVPDYIPQDDYVIKGGGGSAGYKRYDVIESDFKANNMILT